MRFISRHCTTCGTDTMHTHTMSGDICVHCKVPAPNVSLQLAEKLTSRRKRFFRSYGVVQARNIMGAMKRRHEADRAKSLTEDGIRFADRKLRK